MQAVDIMELLKQVGGLHGLPDLHHTGVRLASSKEHVLDLAGLTPLEDIIFGALRPIQAGCCAKEAAARFQLARNMAFYLLDSRGEGPSLPFRERQDRLEYILLKEVRENEKLVKFDPVRHGDPLRDDFVRCMPPHLLVWLLTEMSAYDPIMADPSKARALDPEAINEESELLELARM